MLNRRWLHFQVLRARYHDEQNEDYGRECSPTLGSGGKTLQPFILIHVFQIGSTGELAPSPAADNLLARITDENEALSAIVLLHA